MTLTGGHGIVVKILLCVCVCMRAKSLQSCPILCEPMDCNPPGFSVHGILQARILEWVAMPFCRGSSRPRDWTCVSYVSCGGRHVLYHLCHLGSPKTLLGAAIWRLDCWGLKGSGSRMPQTQDWQFGAGCWQETSVPYRVDLTTGHCLSVLVTCHLASRRASILRGNKVGLAVSFMT